MPAVAVVLLVVWLVLVAGVRGYLASRRTGELSVAFRDRRGSAQSWARLISGLGLLLAVAAPIASVAGLPSIGGLATPVVGVAGTLLALVGIAATIAAQSAMGPWWRGDVDPDARTPLVTTGPFRQVRNPVLAATALTAIGITLVVPNPLSLAGLLAILAGQQIQVRLVEEPYLLRVHGDAYREYARRTGRFLPGVGRLRPDDG
ncbi:MAG TPA: isoprenylcysteine carboxylmethyltransferase family protein [Candidatus Limnocylindrales bacterium]